MSQNVQSRRVSISTPDGPMAAFLAMPEKVAAGRRIPAVIVFQEAFGVNRQIQGVCERFAREGYMALAPELFHRMGEGTVFGYDEFSKVRPALSELSNDQLLTDARASLDFLTRLPECDASRVATIGYCMGGFVSILSACHLPLATAVSYYGGGMMRKREGIGFSPIAGEFSNLRCPVLLIFGEEDQSIPREDIDAVRGALTDARKAFEIEVYSGAGHGFFSEDRASYHAEASAKAWERTLDWFRKRL